MCIVIGYSLSKGSFRWVSCYCCFIKVVFGGPFSPPLGETDPTCCAFPMQVSSAVTWKRLFSVHLWRRLGAGPPSNFSELDRGQFSCWKVVQREGSLPAACHFYQMRLGVCQLRKHRAICGCWKRSPRPALELRDGLLFPGMSHILSEPR